MLTMVLKPDQQHVKDLLTETITLLCCNGLHFKSEFSIDALIGITLDHDEVFLVSIKETFHNDKAGISKKRRVQPEPNTHLFGSFGCNATPLRSSAINEGSGFKDEMHVAGAEVLEDSTVRDFSQQKYLKASIHTGSQKQLCNKRKHRTPLKFANSISVDCLAEVQSTDKPAKVKRPMLEMSTSSVCSDKSESVNRERFSVGCADSPENAFAKTDTLHEDNSTDKPADFFRRELMQSEADVNREACEKDEFCYDSSNEIVFIKEEPMEKNPMQGTRGNSSINPRQCADEEFNCRSQHSMNFSSSVRSMHSAFVQLQDPVGCSSWNYPESNNCVQMPFLNRHRWHLEPVESQLSEKGADEPPDLNAAEISYVRDILSISGSFINIGSAKAFHRNLRQLSREDLSVLLTKMNVPMNSCYCVGVLCTDGVSRVFYKCPPELLHEEAVKFYDLIPDTYAAVYAGQVKVSKRVLDPFEWVQKLSKCSPYATM